MPVRYASIKGMSELGEALRRLPDAVLEIARGSMSEGAAIIQRAIQQEAPVASGLLRSSIRIGRRRREERQGKVVFVIYVRTGTRKLRGAARQKGSVGYATQGGPYYWVFQEFGTSRMHAHPFMVPGFESSAQAALETTRDSARSRLEQKMKQQLR